MKFDNAFRTSKGNVGIQFKHKGNIVTAYRDHENKIVCDETYPEDVKDKVVKLFAHYEKWYVKH